LPLAVAPEDFAAVVRALPRAGFAGANVTIPHKEAAFAVCDDLDPSASRAGAVNTLVFRNGKIHGFNTDGAGFVANLRAHGVDPASGPALILGAGGAARAIGAALQDAGASVTFSNRTPGRADALAAALPGAATVEWANRAGALQKFALLVNTTSLGMAGQPPLEIDLSFAAPGLAVADVVYVPLETKLLADARARGLQAVEGLGMLLHQGVPGFAAWFGVTPVVDAEIYRIAGAKL
jgi:shikimate dehydrogenase